jgi:signal transduction histidine kinase
VHEQEGKDLDGNTIWSEIVATSVKDKDGNITAALELVIPITERKKLEAQLRQAQKMEAIGQLAGGIAHDFNNALTLIKAYSQLTLFDLKESDPLREKIEMILEATNRSADLAHRLLAFSRRQVMEMKVLDLNNLLKDLDKMLRRVIGEDIELVNVLAEDLGRVKVDPGQVEQVVLNLALNAKDAMPRGGKLTIETANVELDETYSRTHVDVIPGRYVMLAVSDTGIGMTPEIKNRLFEPFFTTKEKGKGTGLGLAMVYGIVKQSGGNIWVYSEAGMGTTFKVYLPRVDEPLEEKKKRKLSEGELPRGGETVLAVEDNKDVRRMAAQILKRQGYRVLEAANGGEALLVCEKLKEEIHLLLTDVVMPGMSGHELAQRLSFLRPEMKILYMSGYSDDSIASYGILNEKVGFIPKPFSLEALVNRVREVLDK